ncbi:dihydroorotate dehydrogenase electron transfer subunit [Stratiformator vulcanicus]|uniref:Dihydroorotate dehydrogenase B (NAD(+)), electron transfer subunit n=1 Tax=Stratiformator vulcanicus TaxID=2527980 RepID=A0A517R0G3_9PLAN|nr:dihydroorotate dehydrogenase electron transfer subunit [Stratiformator vulcanicus]QDT37310.1 Dihydroorotate dehydrogenase B (NAD(+)), electron transfer subunit [Stratiformator vulcanicus]
MPTAGTTGSGLHPAALTEIATVVEQECLAERTYRLRLSCPEIASRITPGQFIMIRPTSGSDPLLGRPFALYDTYFEDRRPVGLDFGYVTIGKLTGLMPDWTAGQQVEVWGPLGNGFEVPQCRHLMMVAGGIGQTPFVAVSREAARVNAYGSPAREVASRPERMTLCYGARSKNYLAGLDDFNAPGLEVRLSTDDGSAGHHGFVTELSASVLDSDDPPDLVYCCGPEPMMEAVAEQCVSRNVECYLSLESPMACGFGACFSCVAKVRTDDGEWDYRRSCVEGPVFPADRLIFD